MDDEEDSEELQRLYAKFMREDTDEKVISTCCPKCHSVEMGYHIANKEYDCGDCGFHWKNRPAESTEGEASPIYDNDRIGMAVIVECPDCGQPMEHVLSEECQDDDTTVRTGVYVCRRCLPGEAIGD